MPLPSSGSLSLGQIGTELQQGYLSLRSLSSVAGKGTPDAISEFYGYSNGPSEELLYVAVYLDDPCRYDFGNIYRVDGKIVFRSVNGGDTVLTSLNQWFEYNYGEYPWIYGYFGIDKRTGFDRYLGTYASYCDPYTIK